MAKVNKLYIIASSSAWVAAFLNVLPGLGAGYLYQRRWKAYWITSAVNLLTLVFIQIAQLTIDPIDPSPNDLSQYNFSSILCISIITSIEAVFTVRKTRKMDTLT